VPSRTPYIGRFAPSPTGDLHFGSLVAAVGSFLQARRHGGTWLIRIEDIDPPREVAGSAERILEDLARLGMESDQPVLYQSTRLPAFRAAAEQLLDAGLAFHCACSRADLPDDSVYPGTCRDSLRPGGRARSIRVKVEDRCRSLDDGVQGRFQQNLARDCGDFVIWRADGLPAYQLAVVVDDAHQGITEVVRGADLLDSTPRQIHLLEALRLPIPTYVHLPVALGQDGRKLSKRLKSDPLVGSRPVDSLDRALRFLGQQPPRTGSLKDLWDWALAHWNPTRIPRSHNG